jgi:hypothetical protein
VRGNQTHALKLREVVEAYKDLFDRHALELLARLLGSADAVKAFKLLTRNRSEYEYVCLSILTACVEAEKLARTFPEELRKAKEMISRMEQRNKAVVELREFVVETTKQEASVADDPSLLSEIKREKVAAMAHGLDLIADRIEAKACRAKEAMAWLGVTRKAQSKEAAQLSAIWSLANQVLRTTGKPHEAAVADLARVILGSEVSLERVHHVLRSRRSKQFKEMVAAQTRRAAVTNEVIAEVKRRAELKRAPSR